MSSVAFLGPKPGSSFSVTGGPSIDAWGVLPDGSTVWDQPASDGVTVTVTTARSDFNTFPESVGFRFSTTGFDTNAAGSGSVYDAGFHKLYAFWDYGESYQFSAPTRILDADKDSRYSQGPLGLHTYRGAGPFTWRLALYDPSSGKWGQTSGTVECVDPSTLYVGTRTLYVDQDGAAGGYPDAPGGAATYDDFDTAWGIWRSATEPCRIVLARGQTHPSSTGNGLYAPASGAQLAPRIEGNTGAGTKPVINFTGGRGLFLQDNSTEYATGATSNLTLSDFIFRGPWRGDLGEAQSDFYFALMREHSATHICVDQVNIEGSQAGFLARNDKAGMISINDTALIEQENYLLLGGVGNGWTGIVGSMVDNPDDSWQAWTGMENAIVAPIRVSRTLYCVMIKNDIYKAGGWFVQSGNTMPDYQPAMRFASSLDSTDEGTRYVVNSNVLESPGFQVIGIGGDTTEYDCPINAVVEGNQLLGGFNGRYLVTTTLSGPTIRNNIMTFPDVERDADSTGRSNYVPSGTVHIEWGKEPSGNRSPNYYSAPIEVYNNTIVNLMTGAHSPSGDGSISATLRTNGVNGALFTGYVEANNVVIQPNLDTPEATHTAMQVAGTFTAKYPGILDDVTTTVNTTFETPDASAGIWTPGAGSSALGASTGSYISATSFAASYEAADIISAVDRDAGAVQS